MPTTVPNAGASRFADVWLEPADFRDDPRLEPVERPDAPLLRRSKWLLSAICCAIVPLGHEPTLPAGGDQGYRRNFNIGPPREHPFAERPSHDRRAG